MTKHTRTTKTTDQTAPTITTNGHQVGQTITVPADTLLMERNIRQADVDTDLVRSLRDVGMVQPIVAVLTETGGLLVRHGHRRTLAAVTAEVPALVYISGTDSTTTDAEITRVITQHDENTHRAGLTAADEVGVVEQLAAFGLTANQIAKRSRIKRTQVDNALAVAGSDLAKKATARYDALTLDQAAVVAEFEDDTETAKALIVAANQDPSGGRFDHAAQRARDDRARQVAHDQARTEAEATGIRIIDSPNHDETPKRLDRLTDTAQGATLTVESHAECPGHVAWLVETTIWIDADGAEVDPMTRWDDQPEDDQVEQDGEGDDPEPVYRNPYDGLERASAWRLAHGCENPAENGHHDAWAAAYATSGTNPARAEDLTEEQREAIKAERRLVRENNLAWDSAETVRREHLTAFTARKTAPKGTGAFLATTLARDSRILANIEANHLATTWLGGTPSPYGTDETAATLAAAATEPRATLIALIQVLAAHEADLTRASWRGDGTHNTAGRYLRFLSEATGYTLSEVEEYAASEQTA